MGVGVISDRFGHGIAERAVQERGKSWAYRWWQLVILCIRAVTPIAYIFTAGLIMSQRGAALLTTLPFVHLIGFSCLSTWMLAETIWFPYYLWTVQRLQRVSTPPHHSSTPFNARRKLLLQCLDALEAGARSGTAERLQDLRNVISGWFLGAPFESIHRENFASWVAWAFFDSNYDEMDEKGKAQTDELATIVEDRLSYTFPAGRNPNVKCIRLTLDPVQAAHRPLIYYAVVIAINRFAQQMIRRLGFRQRTLDPLDVAGTGTLRYLYRAPSETMPRGSMPVVFIHGIGIGLGAYLPFLMKLPRNVPVYLLEWPHVSMQLSEEVPSIPDTLAFLSSMLNRDGHAKATFVAHSLGTVAVSWMLRSRLHRNRVGAAVLLDPVTFLLHDPSVAFNFLYRPPHTVLELLMSYFVSREMYIAHSLSRHFHWSKNVLFFEDLPAKGKNVVVLSEDDAIVPAPRVKAYLENKLRMAAVLSEGSDSENEEIAEQPISKARNLKVHYYPGRQHGEMLVRPSMLATLEQEILVACGADKPATDALEDAVVVEEEPKASVTVHRRRSTHLAKLKIAPSKQYKPAWKVKMAKGADESPRIMVVRSSVGRV